MTRHAYSHAIGVVVGRGPAVLIEVRPNGRPTRKPSLVSRGSIDKITEIKNQPPFRTVSATTVIVAATSSMSIVAISHTAPLKGAPFHHSSHHDIGCPYRRSHRVPATSRPRRGDQISREIDTDHLCAESGKAPRCSAVPASHVERSRTEQRFRKQVADAIHDDSVADADPRRVPVCDLVIAWTQDRLAAFRWRCMVGPAGAGTSTASRRVFDATARLFAGVTMKVAQRSRRTAHANAAKTRDLRRPRALQHRDQADPDDPAPC